MKRTSVTLPDELATLVQHEAPAAEWPRITELVRRYGDFPLGGTDASVISLAEKLETDTIITLDHRHFGRVKPRHVKRFTLLPTR